MLLRDWRVYLAIDKINCIHLDREQWRRIRWSNLSKTLRESESTPDLLKPA
jgi:hypothetical protein